MLRKIRIILAVLFFIAVTALFLDFTGSIHRWLGWTAKVQFLPALLALNAGVVLALMLLTLLVGRVYCSVICPLGVFQDIISWLHSRGKRARNRFYYYREMRVLRYSVLGVFIICLAGGIGSVATLLEPYSSYGRMAANLLAPLYRWGNNVLAYFAERIDSYAFYETDVWMKSLPTFVIAIATFIIIGVLAWCSGRTYCNTICPVGTLLGLLSRFSLLRPVIDSDKCKECSLCSKTCKASCINYRKRYIDHSRCVACMDCLDNCKHGAIRLQFRLGKDSTPKRPKPVQPIEQEQVNSARRMFLSGMTMAVATATVRAQEKRVDGGLAVIEDKQPPVRRTPIVPPGAGDMHHFAQHCTACQLCVSVCPNDVLRPSTDLTRLMQPEMSYERGYCRPECTRCSSVCPTSAILPITREEKSSTRIGHAVWIGKNCIPLRDGVECGNCATHCPSGAIQMVPSDVDNEMSVRIPIINTERCIGCGACENLCPARPFSAIYVEGNERHSEM